MSNSNKFSAQYLIIVTFLILCSFSAKAYQGVGFSSITLQKDTLYGHDTIRGSAQLHNYDTTAFTGTIQFGLTVNGVIRQFYQIDTFFAPLQKNDSVLINFKIVTTSLTFKTGPDVVVIWPKPVQTPPVQIDSTQFVVYWYQFPLGLNDKFKESCQIYLAENKVHLNLKELQNEVKQVRISNLEGKLLYRFENSFPKEIPFEKETRGIYFIELEWRDNSKKVIQIFNP